MTRPLAGSILTLDLSGRLGWAWGAPNMAPRFGLVELVPYGTRRDRADSILAAGIDTIADLLRLYPAARVIAEAPLPIQGQTHQTSAEAQYGLHAMARLVCYRRQVPLTRVSADTARKAVLGRARFGGRDKAKAAVMAWAHKQGFRVTEDGEADALVLLVHALIPACGNGTDRRGNAGLS